MHDNARINAFPQLVRTSGRLVASAVSSGRQITACNIFKHSKRTRKIN